MNKRLMAFDTIFKKDQYIRESKEIQGTAKSIPET